MAELFYGWNCLPYFSQLSGSSYTSNVGRSDDLYRCSQICFVCSICCFVSKPALQRWRWLKINVKFRIFWPRVNISDGWAKCVSQANDPTTNILLTERRWTVSGIRDRLAKRTRTSKTKHRPAPATTVGQILSIHQEHHITGKHLLRKTASCTSFDICNVNSGRLFIESTQFARVFFIFLSL